MLFANGHVCPMLCDSVGEEVKITRVDYIFKSCCALGKDFWHKDGRHKSKKTVTEAGRKAGGSFHHSSSSLPWRANQGRNTKEGILSHKLFEEFGFVSKKEVE